MSANQGQHLGGVEDTLKDFWATRPRRPRRGRKLAGVAAGIGNRYAIDPIVVRVGFVVATFYGGAGILFYLLGWLLLPEQDDEAAPFESMVNHKRSSMSGAFTVLLCLALIPAFWFSVVDNEFSGIAGALIVAGTLYFLHRTRGHLRRPATAPSMAPPVGEPVGFYPPPMSTASMTTPMAAPGAAPGAESVADAPVEPPVDVPTQTTPPAWDPLGAAPFAWDLPEPSTPTPEPPAPRRKSKAGLFTLGAALVTVGVLAAISPYVGSWLVPHHFIGVLLAVIGLGMVGGAFVRGGRGLIGIAVPLSVVGIGLTMFSPEGWHGAGDIKANPTTIDEVQHSYRLSVGQVTLDLTGLPSEGEVDTKVRIDAAGEARVIVPTNADVEISCVAHLGDANCFDKHASGSGADIDTFTDYGPDGEGGLKIELDVEVGTGQVEVHRG